MRFIYAIITLFSKITYYLRRLSSIEIDVIVAKKHVFLNFVEKYVRLKLKKES